MRFDAGAAPMENSQIGSCTPVASRRVISPSSEDLATLRQPLTPGERWVLELFDAKLDPAWEIYIQPHLNGLRPDFVLLNPNVGVAVFEVKDWDLDAMHYYVTDTRPPELRGRRDGKSFTLQGQNPLTKVNYYRDTIYKLYCPRLKQNAGFAAITAGVIFPFAEAGRVRELFSAFITRSENDPLARYQPITGATELAEGQIDKIFPESTRQSSRVMREEFAADLRGWLVEPDFSVSQRQPLEMDPNQRMLAEERTASGYRRIKGPAGSGKSLVLAARAAKLADEGKSVLVATFNITLWHYLRDLVVRALSDPRSYRNIVFVNFHSWCKQVCMDVGWGDRYDDLWKSDGAATVLDSELPRLVAAASDAGDAPRYDAILVDEGQDYRPLWWNTLRRFLKPSGEMMLVADATQDVDGTAAAWTDETMTGAGFRGAWAQLDTSYRLPPSAVPLVRDFVARFLPQKGAELPVLAQESLDLFPTRLRWVQCHSEIAIRASVSELRRMMQQTGSASLANADITFLASDVMTGSNVVARLRELEIASVATFAPDKQERRREKMAFYMGDARIKATTLHSFKGWEAPLLVVHIDAAAGAQSLALIYAGLTRLKRRGAGSSLTVVCSAPELLEFGRTWPEFVEA